MNAPRLAVLVDGDNISARHADAVLNRVARRGRIDVARVYMANLQPSDWLTAPGYRVIHAGGGKNAADILLCIDAMELALTRGIEGFALVSSDRDFTHLAHRLRERGLEVLGLGADKAPEGFRRACTAFDLLQDGPPPPTPPKHGPSAFDIDIRNVIDETGGRGGGLPLKDLGNRMRARHGTQIKNSPERSWRAYLAARPHLYAVDPPGPQARVRILDPGFGGVDGS